MMTPKLSTLLFCAATASAAAVLQSTSITADNVAQFAPGTLKCTTGGECLTADEVASLSTAAFKDLNVSNRNAQVAILATIAFESLDFKFCKNLAHPASQGTYSQISLTNLIEYGATLQPPQKGSGNTASDEPFIQGLCNNHKIAFESGFFYFQKGGFSQSVRDEVEQQGSDQSYSDYVTHGLFAPMTAERLAKFQLVKSVIGGSTSSTPSSASSPSNSTSSVAS